MQATVQYPTVVNFSKSENENTTLGFSSGDFSSHFSDPNAGMSLTSVQITSLPSHGTLTLNGSGVTAPQWITAANLGGLVYTPSSYYAGSDSFGWTGYDGTYLASNSASVNITVQATVQYPTVSSFSKTDNENTTLSFSASDFSSNFSDPNAGLALTSVQIQSLPSHGTLTLSGSSVATSEWIATGNLGGLVYTPSSYYAGSDSFGWTGYDGTYSASNSASVNITVQATVQPPTVTLVSPSSGSTAGGTAVTITGTDLTNGSFTVYFGASVATIAGASESQITATSPAHAVGSVYVTVVNSGGTSPTSAADQFTYVTSTNAPLVTANPVSKTTDSGLATAVTFTAAASGTPTPTVKWQVNTGSGFADLSNGGVYSGVTSPTLTVTGATLAMNGDQYRAVFTNGTAPDAPTNPATLTVNAAPGITPGALPNGTNNVSYSRTITASGGTGMVTLAVSNVEGVISGLTIPSTGTGSIAISGTPTATGIETFTVTATDSVGGQATNTYTITVNPAVTLSPNTLPQGTVSAPYSQAIAASGGTGTVTLAVTNVQGAITGLTIPGSGTGSVSISGTPTTAGVETFTLTATDSIGGWTSNAYLITISPASVLNVSTKSLALPSTTQGTVGANATFTVGGSGLASNDTVTLSAPAACEISTSSSSGFAGSLTLNANSSGSLSTTTIYAHISASAAASVGGYLTVNDAAYSRQTGPC